MSIDAVISQVDQIPGTGDVVIRLEPRIDKDGNKTIPGVPLLTIARPRYIPKKGQQIWGGGDTCRLVANVPDSEAIEYSRIGFSTLVEVKPKQEPKTVSLTEKE